MDETGVSASLTIVVKSVIMRSLEHVFLFISQTLVKPVSGHEAVALLLEHSNWVQKRNESLHVLNIKGHLLLLLKLSDWQLNLRLLRTILSHLVSLRISKGEGFVARLVL